MNKNNTVKRHDRYNYSTGNAEGDRKGALLLYTMNWLARLVYSRDCSLSVLASALSELDYFHDTI